MRYDPDWKKKTAGSKVLHTDFFPDYQDDPEDSLRHEGPVSPRERHKYLIVHSPVSSEIENAPLNPLPSSFHLHPPEDQDTVLSAPHSSSASLENMWHSNSYKPTNDHKHNINQHQSAAGISPVSSTQQRHYDGANRSIAQEPNSDKITAVPVQRRHTKKIRPSRLKEDMVERNKATLGINRHKQGSYLKAYEQKGEKQDDAYQVSVYY